MMSEMNEVVELLKSVQSQLTRLEQKLENLTIGEFSGTVNAQNIIVSSGGVTFDEEVDSVSISVVASGGVTFGEEVDSVSIATVASGGVVFESDVSDVNMGNINKVDISGNIENMNS